MKHKCFWWLNPQITTSHHFYLFRSTLGESPSVPPQFNVQSKPRWEGGPIEGTGIVYQENNEIFSSASCRYINHILNSLFIFTWWNQHFPSRAFCIFTPTIRSPMALLFDYYHLFHSFLSSHFLQFDLLTTFNSDIKNIPSGSSISHLIPSFPRIFQRPIRSQTGCPPCGAIKSDPDRLVSVSSHSSTASSCHSPVLHPLPLWSLRKGGRLAASPAFVPSSMRSVSYLHFP